jgi:hypothetical protein
MPTEIIMETNQLMVFREIIDFISESHIKSTVRYSSKKVELVNVKSEVTLHSHMIERANLK